MHDPKFEKEVQQKMEELEFTPSEVVWANLQSELHKEKRRKAPLFWLFFLLGGMLLGAGGASLFYFHRPPSGVSGAGSPSAPKAVTVTGVPAMSQATSATGTETMTHTTNSTGHPIMKNAIGTETAGTGRTETAGTGRTETAGTGRTETAGTERIGKSAETRNTDINRSSGGAGTEPEISGRPGATETTGSAEREYPAMQATAVTPMAVLLHSDPAGDISLSGDAIRLSPATLNSTSLSKSANGLAIEPAAAMENKRAAKRARFSGTPGWEAGFAGGGGISSAVLAQQQPSPLPASGMTTPASSLALSLQSSASPAGHLQLRVSKIQPDLSFWAGLFVQRPVLKRLSLGVGLNLHYYSTRLETGQKAPDSISTGLASLFYPSPYVRQTQGSPYYSPYNYSYSNHYYFLEIPISIQWQFNRSSKTPLFWEGGLSLSRLISANALYYNEKSGVYYKDGGAASPNHLMAFSSLMVGLRWRGNLIKLGPEGQYGLSSLVNPAYSGSQHLYYGGIKIIVIPRKW